ncbi:Kinesin-like protein [Quillaja saponaria]|uniref:Kinesin-like protein n=1 Tax=Quillaja saponaria TaxID=32244 RepID=A0AAD7PM54_QUISA|nr:Kinesin-like protein [Quillaja saponaria]
MSFCSPEIKTVLVNVGTTGESVRTLRFGQRVRSIKNEPLINEITEDDVNDLSDQIRQLKEELIRAKSNVHNSVGSKSGYFQGQKVRDSLNQLRVSLNRSLLLPHIDNDTDEEVNVDEDDVRKLFQQIDDLHSCEKNPRDISVIQDSSQISSAEESCEIDSHMTDSGEIETEEECPVKTLNKLPHEDHVALADNTSKALNSAFRNSISICCQSPILEGPLLSESPKIGNIQRKSIVISSSFLGSQNNVSDSPNFNKDVSRQSLRSSEHIRSSLQSSKIFPGPTESLAASLQRGLQIIDYHQRNSASIKSSASFSFEHLSPSLDGGPHTLLCASCQQKIPRSNSTGLEDSLKARTLAVEEAENLTDEVSKNLEILVTKASKREKELETVCKEQAVKIEQLNQLLLRSNLSDNHLAEIMEEKCEIKEVQEELVQRDSSFDNNEKESLLKEIQILKSKLQLYNDASIQLRKSGVFCQEIGDEEIEKERQRWTEMEGDWISLTDELRLDIESNRQQAEKMEMELRLEKKCTEELDDALKRAVLGHARFVEHYAELQEKYNDLASKYRAIMEGIAEVKKAAAKAGKKGHGSRFSKSLAAELSALRVEREREREVLKKENKSLKIQLRDTAEAVHAAGELLVRLREAEQAASVAEENFSKVQEDNEKLKKQMEKLKRKHKMEMITMKQYLAESRLPESALQPLYKDDSDAAQNNVISPV